MRSPIFPWYYAPIYPFAAALAIGGGEGGLARKIGDRSWRPASRWQRAQLVAAVFVKMPADRDFWVAGYFTVSDAVPRRQDVTVAAPEIGAVGWRVWPAAILDLERLVTPSAVGRPAEDYVKRHEAPIPDFADRDGAGVARAAGTGTTAGSPGNTSWRRQGTILNTTASFDLQTAVRFTTEDTEEWQGGR